MIKGSTLLGYDDKPSGNRKKLKHSDWLIIIASTFPIWLPILITVIVAAVLIFTVLVVAFVVLGFGAVLLFVYSAFSLMSDLWPSVIKMGLCLVTSGVTVIFVAGLFKGIIVFFKLLKNGYLKIKNNLLLKKLEGQKDEQND